MNFFTKAILASVAVLVVAASVVLLFRSREAGRIEAVVREATEWVRRGDAERVASLVDERFEGGADEARAEVRRRIKPGAFSKVEIATIKIGVEGDDARVELGLRNFYPDLPYPNYVQQVVIRMRHREEGWKVSGVELVDRLRKR